MSNECPNNIAETTLNELFKRPALFASNLESLEFSVLIHMSYMYAGLNIYDWYIDSNQKKSLNCGCEYPSSYLQNLVNTKQLDLKEAMGRLVALLKSFYDEIKVEHPVFCACCVNNKEINIFKPVTK